MAGGWGRGGRGEGWGWRCRMPGGAGGVDMVARLSCIGFFVGLREKKTSVMSLVIRKFVQCSYTEVCSEKSYMK